MVRLVKSKFYVMPKQQGFLVSDKPSLLEYKN